MKKGRQDRIAETLTENYINSILINAHNYITEFQKNRLFSNHRLKELQRKKENVTLIFIR